MMSLNGMNQTLFERATNVASLYQAWRKVRANRGAAGIDAVSLQAFESNLEANLCELSRNLQSGTYQCMPARFLKISKDNGKERELGILTVRDRVAQRSMLDTIEPLFEPQFLDCNFAFRQGRSVEMAIQQIIGARANGFCWMVESDVENFFCSIDRKLLLYELYQTIKDRKVLQLLDDWLNAGVLDDELDSITSSSLWQHGKETIANIRLMMNESVNKSIDHYVSQQLGINEPMYDTSGLQSIDDGSFENIRRQTEDRARHEGIKRLFQDGILLAISQRALFGKLFNPKLIGIGGLAIAAFMFAPKAMNVYQNYFHPRLGTLQGAPISPLFTNVYMTPFDRALTNAGMRLIRYCDDFVIQCRTKAEAHVALIACEKALNERHLKIHPEKTRIVAPEEEFEFLGYVFTADGRIVPPPGVPKQVVRQLRTMAHKAAVCWRKGR
jgi:retron-type reverse transcriptase